VTNSVINVENLFKVLWDSDTACNRVLLFLTTQASKLLVSL